MKFRDFEEELRDGMLVRLISIVSPEFVLVSSEFVPGIRGGVPGIRVPTIPVSPELRELFAGNCNSLSPKSEIRLSPEFRCL